MPTHLRRYDEPGHTHFWTISCYRRLTFFHDDGMKRIVVDGLHALHERFDVCLVGYVTMPEHVHALIYPHPRGCDSPIPISTLLHAFKKHVGFHGRRRLEWVIQQQGRLWSEPLRHWASHGFDKRDLWNVRGYDFNVHTRAALIEKLDYCHTNPITRGLVERAEDWPWSSYRFYEFADSSVLPMNWNGTWPIGW